MAKKHKILKVNTRNKFKTTAKTTCKMSKAESCKRSSTFCTLKTKAREARNHNISQTIKKAANRIWFRLKSKLKTFIS